MKGLGRILILIGVALGASPAGSCAQWVEPPGEGWVQVALYHHDTHTVFGSEGNTERIFASGHSVATSLYTTAAVGLVPGLDTWVQVPVHRLVFEDAAGRHERTGLGDPRMYLRLGPEVVRRSSPLAVAVRAGVKWPGGDFPVDAEVIPLGEGQRDWEVMIEGGHAFRHRPLYVKGWVGHRWRETNEETARDPGDEWFAYVAAGGRFFERLTWKLAVEGWTSRTPKIQGISVPSAQREMLQVLPRIGWPFGGGRAEVGARIPLAGRNLPAGPALVLGYFVDWDAPE